MSSHQNHFRTVAALFFMIVFAGNVCYQNAFQELNDPMQMEVCDHTDSEKECDGKEKGQADDFIKQEVNRELITAVTNSDLGVYTQPAYLFGHREIVTPPPEL